MQKASQLLSSVILFALVTQSLAKDLDQQIISAQETVKASGIKGGLVVHVGNGDGTVTAEKKALEPLPSYKDKQHLRSFRSGRALGLKVTERDKQHGAPSIHRNLWSRPSPIFVRALVCFGK